MSNRPFFNYPAFNALAARLRAKGFVVINPAEKDGGDTSQTWDYYIRRCLVDIAEARAFVALPGWENSKGARLEAHIGRTLGCPVLEAAELEGIDG